MVAAVEGKPLLSRSHEVANVMHETTGHSSSTSAVNLLFGGFIEIVVTIAKYTFSVSI